MKVMTILGTRPEIIRLSRVIEKLDKNCDHILVHTGQNFEEKLNEIFFKDLKVREPDYFLGVRAGSFAEQIGKILVETEKVILKEKPDRNTHPRGHQQRAFRHCGQAHGHPRFSHGSRQPLL